MSELSLFDLLELPVPTAAEKAVPSSNKLDMRPYQRDALAAIIEAFKTHRTTLAVAATGTGKTVLFAHLIKAMPGDGRILILAHREELISQARDKVRHVTGQRPTIEKAEFVANDRARVVVSSIQTQVSKSRKTKAHRMEKFNPRDFCLLIVDEAHRAVADTYRAAIKYYTEGNPDLRVLGVTATPDRGDQMALGKVFESVAFRFPIYDAVEGGWLVPVMQRCVTVTGLDLSKIRTTAGDLNGHDLEAVLRYEENLLGMAEPVLQLARGRQTLVFCASVAHAERFAEILNRHASGVARFVSGKTDDDARRELFVDFAARRFQILCNVGIATEGTDIPGVEVVVMARPTKSRALFEQMIGRGLRPHESIASALGTVPTDAGRRAMIATSPKPVCEVIDFVGNAGKHKLITVTDVLGGRYDEAVRERAAKKAKAAEKQGIPADVAELLKAAKEELDAAEAKRKRLEEEEKARRTIVKPSSTWRVKSVDPFDFYDVRPAREIKWDKMPRPTPAQVERLAKYGIEIDPLKTSQGEAGRLISELRGRITAGQAKVLTRCGFNTAEIQGLAVDQASRLIERCKDNGWRRPVDQALVGATEGEI